jgi:hypothetical protein
MRGSTIHDILRGERPAVTYTHPIIDLKSGHVAAREIGRAHV